MLNFKATELFTNNYGISLTITGDLDDNCLGYAQERILESFFSDDYVVTVSADEGTEVDLKDKLALCIRLSNDFMSDYSD